MLYTTIAAWMLTLQPIQEAPWGARFGELANAIDVASHENPVFGSPEKTAAVLTSIAFFESTFNPAAMGDCKKGVEKSVQTCQSFGAFQISKAHASPEVLMDPMEGAREALRLIEVSTRICKARPLGERLGWYAWGRNGCDHSLDKSRHRMTLAKRLFSGAKVADAIPADM